MADDAKKDREHYVRSRSTYLKERITQIDDELRESGKSEKEVKRLRDSKKSAQENLNTLKSESSLSETGMSKLQAIAKAATKISTVAMGAPKGSGAKKNGTGTKGNNGSPKGAPSRHREYDEDDYSGDAFPGKIPAGSASKPKGSAAKKNGTGTKGAPLRSGGSRSVSDEQDEGSSETTTKGAPARRESGSKSSSTKTPKLARESFTSNEMIDKTKTKLKQLKDRLERAKNNPGSQVTVMSLKEEILDTQEFLDQLIAKNKNGSGVARKPVRAEKKTDEDSSSKMPTKRMRENFDRLTELRNKLNNKSLSDSRKKSVQDGIFWAELDLLGDYQDLPESKRNNLDITTIVPQKNIDKILKADKDNEFAKYKEQTGYGAKKSAEPKASPAEKSASSKTGARKLSAEEMKNRSKWDKIADIKKYAKQLNDTTDKSKKNTLCNTIAELYGDLTAAERKNIMLSAYVSKTDMKRMAGHDKAVEKLFNSPSTVFNSPAQIKLNFAKDQKAAGLKKPAPKAGAATDGTRYTKRGVTQMLKELKEKNERGRKGSAAQKQREADIKRLTKILQQLGTKTGLAAVNEHAVIRQIATAHILSV